MNLLSKLEGLFAPEKRKPEVGSYYETAQQQSRRRSPIPGGAPRDQRKDLTGGNRNQILKLSRYAHRNSGLSAEQQKMMAIYAIGGGRWPQSKALDLAWRKTAEERFWQLAKRPEITGRYNWREVQTLVCRHLDRDGEVFAVKTRDTFGLPKIQLLETHAFSNVTDERENIFDGIRYDAIGRPLAYLKLNGNGDPIPLPAASVIHVFDPDSITNSRFVPTGQHGLLHVQDELEMLASEKHAVKRLQQEAMILKSNRENALQDADMGMDSEHLEIEAGTLTTDAQEVAEAFGARVQRIDTDEELSPFEFQRPYSTFGEFLALLERDASGGRLPYEATRDPSKVGGASVRLITSKTERYIADRGATIDDRFNAAVWFYFIGSEIDAGRLPAVPGWNDVEWTSPKRITVDAGRESQAARLDVEMGIATWSDEINARGGDFEDWLARRSDEARQIMRAAGHADDEPIPLWMIYKPSGLSLSGKTEENTDV